MQRLPSEKAASSLKTLSEGELLPFPSLPMGQPQPLVDPGLEWREGVQKVGEKLMPSSMLQLGLECRRLLWAGILLRYCWNYFSLRRKFPRRSGCPVFGCY